MSEKQYRVIEQEEPEPNYPTSPEGGEGQVAVREDMEALSRIERKLDLLLSASGYEEQR